MTLRLLVPHVKHVLVPDEEKHKIAVKGGLLCVPHLVVQVL